MIHQAETLLQRLNIYEVEFVIIGGICNVLHGVTLVTQDLDICCRFEPQNLRKLENALRDLNPLHRQTPQRIPFVLDPQLERELKKLYLRTDMGVLDCLGSVDGLGGFDIVQSMSVEVKLSFGTCQMLSIDALIQSKEALKREQDLAALRQLRAIKENASNQ